MHKRIILLLFVCLSILLGLLDFTNPSSCGPLGVLLFFTTLYGTFFCLAYFLVLVFVLLLGKKAGVFIYFYALVIGFGPILFLFLINFELNKIIAAGVAILFVILGSFLVKNKYSMIK